MCVPSGLRNSVGHLVHGSSSSGNSAPNWGHSVPSWRAPAAPRTVWRRLLATGGPVFSSTSNLLFDALRRGNQAKNSEAKALLRWVVAWASPRDDPLLASHQHPVLWTAAGAARRCSSGKKGLGAREDRNSVAASGGRMGTTRPAGHPCSRTPAPDGLLNVPQTTRASGQTVWANPMCKSGLVAGFVFCLVCWQRELRAG